MASGPAIAGAELHHLIRMRIAEKKAEVLIEDLPEMSANRTQVYQIFQNLISNALKF